MLLDVAVALSSDALTREGEGFLKYLRRKKVSARGGFTLLEASIAGFIFMIVIIGFSSAYIGSIKTQKLAISNFKANCICRNRLQRAMSMDYTSLWALAESNKWVTADGYASATGTFKRTTIVVPDYIPHAPKVSVRVWYPLPFGELSAQTVIVSSLIAPEMMR